MTYPQKQAWRIAVDAVNEYIGGFENQMEDCEEGTEDWKQAYDALHCGHDEIVETCLLWARSSWEWEHLDHIHFVGLDFLRERVEKRVTKYGY